MSVYPYALSVTLTEEGGYVHHQADPGGATNKGVTQGRYDEFRQGLGLEVRPVQDIEQDELEAIYASYWAAVSGDELDPALAVVAFDCSVNHGPGRVAQWFAEETHSAATLTARRLEHYTSLGHWATFGKGWARRAGRVLRAAAVFPMEAV